MEKIILFYKFSPLSDPEAVRLWQLELASSLGLKGRLIIAPHGINGTLGGSVESLKKYISATKSYDAFKGIRFKWSSGSGGDFPRLSVKVRPELVSFGVADSLKFDNGDLVGGGDRLSPADLHHLIKERGSEVVLFDGRSEREAAIGRFKGAVVPAVDQARQFKAEIKKPKYKGLKDNAVVTYCTGGIRCEVLSVLMKQEGFKEVYQLDGGIVKYGERYGDQGYWEGALYVFDGRVSAKFSDSAVDIGSCSFCQGQTSHYDNCSVKECNKLILICDQCRGESVYCRDHSKAGVINE